MDNLIGQQLGGQYVIESLLGKQRGRRTFLARDLAGDLAGDLAQDVQTQPLVVIKLVLFGPDFTWQDLKLFEREAETLKSLDHPAIPKYLDSFELETSGWKGFALVQTYIEAKSLRQWVESGRTYQEEDLRAIATQLLIILSYLHSRYPAVIHRDIKPSNILFKDGVDGEPDEIYLVDFGSVHTISQSGTVTVVGTYGYMPPEQFGGRAVPASDLYGLGVTMVHLMTGIHPAERTASDLQAMINNSTLSVSFKRCLTNLTASELAQRTSSATVAIQQLTTSVTNSPTEHTLSQSRSSNFALTKQPASRAIAFTQPRSFEYSALEVSSTFYEFEIQFFDDRLVGLPSQNRQVPLVIMQALIVLCLFGGLFFSSSVLILAAILLLFVAAVVQPYRLRSQSHRRMIGRAINQRIGIGRQKKERELFALKLWLPSGGPLLIRVDQLKNAASAGRQPEDIANVQRITQLSHLKVTSVEMISPTTDDATQLSICFEQSSKSAANRVSIRGTREEIKWLCNQLTHWKNIPVEKFSTDRLWLADR